MSTSLDIPLTFHKLRGHSRREEGFTLIELLVVILIVGLLAAIALPQFLAQQNKGNDVEAKASAKVAAETMQNCAIDNEGDYNRAGSPCDRSALVALEPLLVDLGTRFEDPVIAHDSYTVTVQSARAPEVSFSIRRRSNGTVDQDCTVGTQDKGGCPNPGAPGDDW